MNLQESTVCSCTFVPQFCSLSLFFNILLVISCVEVDIVFRSFHCLVIKIILWIWIVAFPLICHNSAFFLHVFSGDLQQLDTCSIRCMDKLHMQFGWIDLVDPGDFFQIKFRFQISKILKFVDRTKQYHSFQSFISSVQTRSVTSSITRNNSSTDESLSCMISTGMLPDMEKVVKNILGGYKTAPVWAVVRFNMTLKSFFAALAQTVSARSAFLYKFKVFLRPYVDVCKMKLPDFSGLNVATVVIGQGGRCLAFYDNLCKQLGTCFQKVSCSSSHSIQLFHDNQKLRFVQSPIWWTHSFVQSDQISLCFPFFPYSDSRWSIWHLFSMPSFWKR